MYCSGDRGYNYGWHIDPYAEIRGRGRARSRGRSRGRHRGGGFSRAHKSLFPVPELIEPKKIFVANINRSVTNEVLQEFLSKYVKVVDVNIIKRPPTLNWNFSPYAFVQLESEEDTKQILGLDKSKRYLYGKCMSFKPAKVHFKVPGAFGFQRAPLPDRVFDLEPPNSKEPCIHMLIDDVLLRIFEYLPLKSLVIIERVCRRWQSLVHACFRRKASLGLKGKMNDWLKTNGVTVNLLSISKVLTYCGESMTELHVGEFPISSNNQGKLLRVIAQLCPALQSLTLSHLEDVGIHRSALRELVNSCASLKKFAIEECRSFNEENLQEFILGLPHLETLQVPDSDILGKCFDKLPNSLKVLNISRCHDVKQEYIANIPKRCPLLEDLNLDGVCVQSTLLQEIGKKCQNIKYLGIELGSLEPQVELTDFKNLTRLSYFAYMYNVNSLIKSASNLEELRLDGLIAESLPDGIDFSVLEKLRILQLPWTNKMSISAASIKTISYCKTLEKLKFIGSNDHKPAVLEIIRCCSNLKEMDCPSITLSAEDIHPFSEANKKRKHRLKITIGLDEGALNQIEKLNDSNYEVDMFDVHNLFSDFTVYDEFEDLFGDEDFDDSGSSTPDIDYYDDCVDVWGDLPILGNDQFAMNLFPSFSLGLYDCSDDSD